MLIVHLHHDSSAQCTEARIFCDCHMTPCPLTSIGLERHCILQLCLLEGLAYEQREREKGAANMTMEDYKDMLLLDNQTSAKPEPLLVPGKNCPGVHSVDHKLVIDLVEV